MVIVVVPAATIVTLILPRSSTAAVATAPSADAAEYTILCPGVNPDAAAIAARVIPGVPFSVAGMTATVPLESAGGCVGVGSGVGVCVGVGVGSGVGVCVGVGVGSGVGAWVGAGSGVGSGVGAWVGVGSGVGSGVGAWVGVGSGVGAWVGSEVVSSVPSGSCSSGNPVSPCEPSSAVRSLPSSAAEPPATSCPLMYKIPLATESVNR